MALFSPTKTKKIKPARGLAGSVRLPGDKSISHRYAMLGAIAEGQTEIHYFSSSADCQSTLACLEKLGAKIERKISELCQRHGLRHGRYRGREKTDLQAVLTATMVNTKRLLLLASTEAERGERIWTALAA